MTANPCANLRHACIAPLLAAVITLGLNDGAAGEERSPAQWYRGKLTASAGFDFSTGGYGEAENVTLWYFPLSARYLFEELGLTNWDQIELKVTVPILYLEAPPGVVVGPDGPVPVSPTGETRRTEGLGDVRVRGTYSYISTRPAVPVISVSGELSLPSGSEEDGLGTGETIYTTKLQLAKSFRLGDGSRRLSLFGDAGFRTSKGFDDVWLASGGLNLRVTRNVSVGVAHQWRQASSSRRNDRQELIPFATLTVGRYKLAPYGVVGFSNASPDYGVGLTFSISQRFD